MLTDCALGHRHHNSRMRTFDENLSARISMWAQGRSFPWTQQVWWNHCRFEIVPVVFKRLHYGIARESPGKQDLVWTTAWLKLSVEWTPVFKDVLIISHIVWKQRCIVTHVLQAIPSLPKYVFDNIVDLLGSMRFTNFCIFDKNVGCPCHCRIVFGDLYFIECFIWSGQFTGQLLNSS